MIKVIVTGSESTGKTTLARQLGSHFNAPVAEEFVRPFAAQRANKLGFADHGPIARGQMASEDHAIAQARDLVILDTDLVSTVLYCEHYFGRSPEWIAQEACTRAGHLYLLMRPDVPWLPDGVRDRGDRREEMHVLFETKLRDLDFGYVEIGGDWDERFRSAVRAIDPLLRG